MYFTYVANYVHIFVMLQCSLKVCDHQTMDSSAILNTKVFTASCVMFDIYMYVHNAC